MVKKEKEELKPINELISLKGKRTLITGAGVGIGRAIARRFAEAGSALELVDIDEEALKEAQMELSQFKVDVNIHKVDLSVKEEIDALWERLRGKEPDILVNNAGVYPTKPFLEIDEPFLKKVLDINLNAVFWMCQHMIRAQIKKGGGVIINIGSIEAVMPFKEDLGHYDVSKAGIMALTRALAHEYGKAGFRINALVPGGIWTPGAKSVAKDVLKLDFKVVKAGIEYTMRTPLGRMGKPDEVARMALVLASDLSSYVHGTLIPVDGGFLSA